MNDIKIFFTTTELARMNLKGIPKNAENIRAKAKRENWSCRKRQGRGGGFEYSISSMSENIQAEIIEKTTLSLRERREGQKENINAENLPDLLNLSELTLRQKECANARLGLVELINEVMAVGRTKKEAINLVIKQYKTGLASDQLRELIDKSNYKPNKGKLGISYKSLSEFVLKAKKADTYEDKILALMPRTSVKSKEPLELEYMDVFLRIYHDSNGISFVDAYKKMVDYIRSIAPDYEILSLSGFKRHFNKLPLNLKYKNRLSGAALKEKFDFIRRNWNLLEVNDCWVGDGHAMKLKVAHPLHGRPFTPELTMIIDARSRMIVGYSLDLAENALAIREALRNAVEKHGIPAIYYSDNGSGQKNSMLDDPAFGVMSMLGITHPTGIPGNPQARGIIERLNKSVAIKIAQKFSTFYGDNADPTNVRKTLRGVKSYENSIRKGKEVSELGKYGAGRLPSWSELIEEIEKGIEEYNKTYHRSVKGVPREIYHSNVRTENKVDSKILDILFMPQVERKTNRGEVQFLGNIYFSKDLVNYSGEEIVVAYDIANGDYVVCKDKQGKIICRAYKDGNLRPAFSKSFVDAARDKRARTRLALVENKRQEILEEQRGSLIEQQTNAGFELLSGINAKAVFEDKAIDDAIVEYVEEEEDEAPIFMFESERLAWERAHAKEDDFKI